MRKPMPVPRALVGLCLVAAALTFLALPPSSVTASVAAQPAAGEQLVRVADDVYLFSMTSYNSLFIVTDEGVILVDPIGIERAPFLQAAIASVTDQPVRYVIYAHDHADHISGGAVFVETAEFVSQTNAVDKVAARGDPLTPVPTIAFDDFMTLTLGGKTVELYYVGLGHSDNNLLLVYPARRLAFGADLIESQSVFTSFGFTPWIDEWAESFDWIYANLDFDTLTAGHGPIGTKETFREARAYFADFMAALRAARAAGLADNSPEMVAYVHDALAPSYGTWARFEDRVAPSITNLLRYWADRGSL
jgi:glyoxylase-like metal-dependent hydrolase (beta-lactamase superfamily II)